jgi:hypothetical protein
MKGKHRHKWDFLRQVLSDRVVYDDNSARVWFFDDMARRGLLYSCKQAQVRCRGARCKGGGEGAGARWRCVGPQSGPTQPEPRPRPRTAALRASAAWLGPRRAPGWHGPHPTPPTSTPTRCSALAAARLPSKAQLSSAQLTTEAWLKAG